MTSKFLVLPLPAVRQAVQWIYFNIKNIIYISEPNYRNLVELLHVPLQSIYTWPCASSLAAVATNGDGAEIHQVN